MIMWAWKQPSLKEGVTAYLSSFFASKIYGDFKNNFRIDNNFELG